MQKITYDSVSTFGPETSDQCKGSREAGRGSSESGGAHSSHSLSSLPAPSPPLANSTCEVHGESISFVRTGQLVAESICGMGLGYHLVSL